MPACIYRRGVSYTGAPGHIACSAASAAAHGAVLFMIKVIGARLLVMSGQHVASIEVHSAFHNTGHARGCRPLNASGTGACIMPGASCACFPASVHTGLQQPCTVCQHVLVQYLLVMPVVPIRLWLFSHPGMTHGLCRGPSLADTPQSCPPTRMPSL